MVKQLLRGEFSILGFLEDHSILSILRREFLLDSLHCLSQGSGECEFSDMGVVFSKYLLEGSCVPLLSIDSGGILGFVSFHSSEIS